LKGIRVPDFSVIAAVSLTLENLLKSKLGGLCSVELRDLKDTIPEAQPLLTVFLFEVGEDPSARNRPRARSAPPEQKLMKPPMALLLRYFLTPWGGNPATHHQILGRAMQVLYDNATISDPDLLGTLANDDQVIKITMAPLSLEERTRVWHAVQKPYRLSVSYEVRVVNLDSEVEEEIKLVNRRGLDLETSEEGR
jgi:hypothetical protein